MSVLKVMSSDKFFLISVIASFKFSVSSRVLISGCLVTVITTAFFPLYEPSPIFGAAPMTTSATSSTFTGTLSTILITELPISLTLLVLPIPLIIYLFPNSLINPPGTFSLDASQVFISSFKETL